MNLELLHQFCLSKKQATEHFPFDSDTLVFKIGGKMFALVSLEAFESGKPAISLKCEPEKAQELRAQFDDIQPGYHLSKVHWNTIQINKQVGNKMIFELIDHSYELVFNSLTKKIQNDILNQEI